MFNDDGRQDDELVVLAGLLGLFALVRRFSTSNLEICSQSRADLRPSQSTSFWVTARRPPRRQSDKRQDARSLRQARTSFYPLHTRWSAQTPASAPAVERPQTLTRK